MAYMRSAVAIIVSSIALTNASTAYADKEFIITKGTEHKIWTSPGFQKACFSWTNLHTGGPARVRFRRTRAGGKKYLDIHTGAKCWNSKAPIYVLYAAADEVDVRLIHHEPNHDWRPGPPDGHRLFEVFSIDDGEEPDILEIFDYKLVE